MIRNIIPYISLFCQSSPRKVLFCSKKFFLGNKTFIVYNFQRFHIDFGNFAKGKDIRKEKKKVVHIDEIELGEFFNVEKLFNDLKQPVEIFKSDLAERTALRSSQGAIENIKVQFEGENYTIQDLATVYKKSEKLYVLDFSSFPQTISTVMKVLNVSDLNLNVQQEGTRVFVPIPKITKEHRETLAKKAKLCFNKCKDDVRDVQNKYLRKLRSIEKLSEEKKFRVTNQISALGDKSIVQAEQIFKTKQNELLKNDE